MRTSRRVVAAAAVSMAAIGLAAAPASAGTNWANFTRSCGTNNAANQNFSSTSAAITSKVSGTCSGDLGVQLRRWDNSLTGVQFSVNTGSGWLSTPGAIQGSYHFGCRSGCGASWLVAV